MSVMLMFAITAATFAQIDRDEDPSGYHYQNVTRSVYECVGFGAWYAPDVRSADAAMARCASTLAYAQSGFRDWLRSRQIDPDSVEGQDLWNAEIRKFRQAAEDSVDEARRARGSAH